MPEAVRVQVLPEGDEETRCGKALANIGGWVLVYLDGRKAPSWFFPHRIRVVEDKKNG